ncbi:MAG: metal ABC transporter permease, partial [Pseudomonadota bacterium]
HWWPEVQEAIIGSAFVLAATASVLLLAGDPHGAEQIKELLGGQILWVSWSQLVQVAIVYAAVLALWFMPWWRSNNLRFYFLFAIAVTASVQMVGVYLVFASLIIPALAVRRLSRTQGLAVGYLVGVLGYAGGLVLSLFSDLPAGALVVWMIALTSVAAALVLRGRAHADATTGQT